MDYTSFSKEDFAALRADVSGDAIDMLNLIRLHERAAYADGRRASGAEAYAAYGRISQPVFARLGGRIVWRGRLDQLLIGPKEETWDVCFIARYPSSTAFADLLRDPLYREAMTHRQAAVANSRLIRLGLAEAGIGFNGADL
jgi:uncharacterized protein (DUF1330 family)